MSSDTPLADALRKAPTNELLIEAEADKSDASADITLQREWGKGNSAGVKGGISRKSGWGIGAFFRKVWPRT